MAQKKNKRHRKVAFVFLEPLTKVPPASAGSGARKRVGPESAMIKNKRHRKVAFFDRKNTSKTHFVHKPMVHFKQ